MGPRLAIALLALAVIWAIDWPAVSRAKSWRVHGTFLALWGVAGVSTVLLAIGYRPPGLLQALVTLVGPIGEWFLGPFSPCVCP